jgi:SPP1 gp7 family putative phage head morphogenesis protein
LLFAVHFGDVHRVGFHRAVRRIRRLLPPKQITASYYGELRTMVDTAHGALVLSLVPHLGKLVDATAGVHHDAAYPHRINRVIRQAQDAFDRRFPLKRITGIVEKIGKRTSDHHLREMKKQLAFSGLAVSLDHVARKGTRLHLRHFVADNVALIQDMPRAYLNQVSDAVLDGVRTGQRAGQIATEIGERTRVSKSRARFIARDQVGKFYGELSKRRQTGLGISKFVWRTSEDERVRESHAELDGETFSWDEGAENSDTGETIFPGSDFQCRCDPEPVLDFARDDDEEAGANGQSDDEEDEG